MPTSITSSCLKGLHVADNTSAQTERCVVDASGYLHQIGTRITKTAAQINALMVSPTAAGVEIKLVPTAQLTASLAATHPFTVVYGVSAQLHMNAAGLIAASTYPQRISWARQGLGGAAATIVIHGTSLNEDGQPKVPVAAATISYMIFGTR